MSELLKEFSVGIYYSGSYHVDVEAANREDAKQAAIDCLRDEIGYGFSIEEMSVEQINGE